MTPYDEAVRELVFRAVAHFVVAALLALTFDTIRSKHFPRARGS